MSFRENLGDVENMYEETQVEWKITDFCKITENGNISFGNSPPFSYANCSWYFQLHPNSSMDPKCTDVYLGCKKEQKREYSVEYAFGLKKVDTDVEHLVTGLFEKNKTFSSPIKIMRSRVIQRKCELLPAGVLTIICTLKRGTIHSTQPKHEPTIKKLIKLETLSENLKSLSLNKENCDVTLNVQEKEYKAHKAILIARSSVFAAMFQHDTAEKKSGIINIPDCDPESFKEFLEFLYCGKLEEISSCNALDLYKTSDKYDVQELKTFCSEFLMQNLTVENLCEIVILADEYDDTKLLSAAQCFFNKNLSGIFVTSEWNHLLNNNPRLVNKLLLEMSSKMKAVD